MRRVFLLRAYGDFAIAVQGLAATDVIVASLHLKPLYDALISRGCISPRLIDFVDFGIKGSQLNLFTNKALFSSDTFRQLSKIKDYISANPGSNDFVEQSTRKGLLNFFTGHSFQSIFETGEPVYAAYGLPALGLERKGDKVLILLKTILQAFHFPARDQKAEASTSQRIVSLEADKLPQPRSSIYETYSRLKNNYKERLSPETYALIEPLLNLSCDILASE